MNDQKLINDYENAVMELAVSDMLEQYGKELEEKYKHDEDIAPSPEAAAKFEKSLNKAYKARRLRSFRTKALKFGRYAVTICAVFIIIFATSVISVDAIRIKFLEWLISIHGTYNSLIISDDNSAYKNMICADNLPNGYELTKYNYNDNLIEAYYSNKTNYVKILVYSDHFNGITFNTDNENPLSEDVYINENRGQYQNSDTASTIFWYNGEKSYCISTDDAQITKDILVEIAQSIN